MAAPTERLSRLPGGLRLPANKSISTGSAIADVAVPPLLTIPLSQHAGQTARPVVAPGERVLRGQPLGVATGAVSATVHASSSGRVVEIGEHAVPAREPTSAPCVVIETDGLDTPWDGCRPLAAADQAEPAALLEAIERGGIAGLGGAAYPTAAKLAQGATSTIDTLILNGVECESYISCDDRLMREHPADILRGAALLLRVVRAGRCIVALESDKPDALAALRAAAGALGDPRIDIVEIPTVYPSGGEDQLVLLLTGREVPSRGLPADAGCLVQNVGTAFAVARVIDAGEPLISRIVTVTGEGIAQPGNYRVRFGTPIAAVARAAGGYNERATRLIMGGPMTGIALTSDELPVVKATNCLLITGAAVHLSAEPRRACIRCGECAEHCPVRLLPQQLLAEAERRRSDELVSLGLDDCIECGCCDLVCPSHIPLTQTFREAKRELSMRIHEKQRAERARERFEAHAARVLARDQEAESARERKRADIDDSAIRAILERSRRRRDD